MATFESCPWCYNNIEEYLRDWYISGELREEEEVLYCPKCHKPIIVLVEYTPYFCCEKYEEDNN